MFGISEIEDKLDKTINYINILKIYSEKERLDEKDVEDINKYLNFSIDNLNKVLKNLGKLHNSFDSNNDLKSTLSNLKNSYIISDKCIEKIAYIEKLGSATMNTYDKNRLKEDELHKIVDNLEDVIDELFDYISY